MLLATAFSVLLVVLQCYSDSIFVPIRYEHTLFETREYWRLLSGHFIHLGWAHFLLNLAGFWLLVFIFIDVEKPLIWAAAVLPVAMGASLGLFLFSPEVVWYIGLSGVLHGLVVFWAISSYRIGTRSSLIFLLGVAIKLFWEQYVADSHAMEATIGGQVVYDAHLYGAISGAIVAVVLILVRMLWVNKPANCVKDACCQVLPNISIFNRDNNANR